jgi:hypothetical protein
LLIYYYHLVYKGKGSKSVDFTWFQYQTLTFFLSFKIGVLNVQRCKTNESKLKDDKKITYKMFLKMKKYILKNNEKISIYFDDENNLCIYKEIKERDEDYLDYYYFESSMNGYLHSFGDSPSKQEIRDDYAFCFSLWYRNGKIHRDFKKPAIQGYERTDEEEYLSTRYFEDGKEIY